jgi:hypothetical protein
MLQSDIDAVFGNNYIQIIEAVLRLSQDGAYTDIFENLSENIAIS